MRVLYIFFVRCGTMQIISLAPPKIKLINDGFMYIRMHTHEHTCM